MTPLPAKTDDSGDLTGPAPGEYRRGVPVRVPGSSLITVRSGNAMGTFMAWLALAMVHVAFTGSEAATSRSFEVVSEATKESKVAAGDIVPVPGAQFEQTLASASPDVLREMIRQFAQRMMDADAEVACNAGYGEVSPDRVNSRNGYRRREWDTRAASATPPASPHSNPPTTASAYK